MKMILLKGVKGQGKKHEVIEVKDGYGNSCFIETVLESSLYIRALSNAIQTEAGYPQPKEQTELKHLEAS